MHLKNFSLVAGQDGIARFTPAYDLLCTRLVIPNDTLALPILGKDNLPQRGTWLKFADYCQLPPKAAERVLDKQASILNDERRLIDRSFLPDEQKEAYKQLLDDRNARLG